MIIVNLLIDHFYAPTGIDFTPLVVIITAALLSITNVKFNIWLRIVFIYVLIGINDIGIKLYGGGVHDFEGQGFVAMFLMIGLIPAFLIISITVFVDKGLSILTKILSLIMFLVLIGLHSYMTKNVGIGRSYPIYQLP
ncbi:MAG: hypothetical protein ABI166_10655 [Mucilaginibacter sp.]